MTTTAFDDWRVDAALAADTTIDGVFRRAFQVFADRVAVSWEDGRLTYGELGCRSWQLANALSALGIRRGDRVAVLSETRHEFIECYAACAALGVTVAALNIRLHPGELEACIDKCRPVALLFAGGSTTVVTALRTTAPTIRHWIGFDTTEGALDYAALLAASPGTEPARIARGDDIHNILFTSGTTGAPKGALISQRAAAVRGLRLAQWFGLGPSDGFVGWLPLFHCGGDESLYATFLTGGIYATFARVDVQAMFRLIERDRLSWTLLLPGVITDFLDHPKRSEHDLRSLRFAIGYANMMPNVIARLTQACGIDFFDAFGQSEVSYLLAHGRSGPGELPSLRKQPSPLLEVRIVDDDMHDAPVGTPGECVVRGASVMSGYLDDDAANRQVFEGGWLHTGDMLKREDDGSLTFVDRKRYLIKTGGENVYPTEVELVVAQHAAVQEVCVFGLPDAYWGEAIKAVVVLRPGSVVTAREIADWCRTRLAGYKRPRFVQFVRSEELPRSTTGKLQRHELARLVVDDDQRVA
ncbi:MAG: o-succinylbenzoate--CoA ligase [Rhizobacter sp.]|nr:o-succinylbenzoate--CoA ligase [Rhizobacter sp.]